MHLSCSNRTFMELKPSRKADEPTVWYGSNRTFMELKLLSFAEQMHLITSSNRTFMELKLRQIKAAAFVGTF